jgi:hypothetical protein
MSVVEEFVGFIAALTYEALFSVLRKYSDKGYIGISNENEMTLATYR